MQEARSERKVPYGKLLRIFVLHDAEIIQSLAVTGDFFIHPEEGLKALEHSVCGLRMTEREELTNAFFAAVEKNNLRLLGFSINDLVDLIAEPK